MEEKKIIILQKKDEYSVQYNEKKEYRVCKGDICSNWMHSRFTSHIPFSPKKYFKRKIDKILRDHGKISKEQ